MKSPLKRGRVLAILVAGAAIPAGLLLARVFAADQQAAQKPPISPRPTNTVQAASPPAVPMPDVRDFGKSVIELPVKRVLAAQSIPAPAQRGPSFVNPKVEPGKVRWHKDFAAACQAAGKSGKPVLLFQMMGKLDDQFC